MTEGRSRGRRPLAEVGVCVGFLLFALVLTFVAWVAAGVECGGEYGCTGWLGGERPWQRDLQFGTAVAGLGLVIAALATAAGERTRATGALLGLAAGTYVAWFAMVASWGSLFD